MQTFVFTEVRKLNDHAKIYSVPPEQPTVGKDYKVSENALPEYTIEVHRKSHTLYSGDVTLERVGEKHPVPLIDVIPEGFFNTVSTFTDSESPARRCITMRREKDDGLFSRQRTFDDFDGDQYKWKASLKGNLTCTRISDNAKIATFSVHFFEFLANNTGILTVYQELSPKSLHLLLSTCMTNYQLERRRRRSD